VVVPIDLLGGRYSTRKTLTDKNEAYAITTENRRELEREYKISECECVAAHPVELETTAGEFSKTDDSERSNATHHVESSLNIMHTTIRLVKKRISDAADLRSMFNKTRVFKRINGGKQFLIRLHLQELVPLLPLPTQTTPIPT
jgi:hypothetical protein